MPVSPCLLKRHPSLEPLRGACVHRASSATVQCLVAAVQQQNKKRSAVVVSFLFILWCARGAKSGLLKRYSAHRAPTLVCFQRAEFK
jgi:hypothetical protein